MKNSLVSTGRIILSALTAVAIGGDESMGGMDAARREAVSCAPDSAIPHSAALSTICVGVRRKISFPAYAVRAADSADSIVETNGIYSCLGVAIYDSKEKKGLLAHFIDGERPDELPVSRGGKTRDEYIAYFRQRYFAASDMNDVSVLLVKGLTSPNDDFAELHNAVGRYFGGARMDVDDHVSNCARRDMKMDVRTGEVVVDDRLMAFEKGTEPTCMPFIVKMMTEVSPEERHEHVLAMREKYSGAVIQSTTWRLK